MKIKTFALGCILLILSVPSIAQTDEERRQTDIKLGQTLDIIRRFYVEKVELSPIVEKGVVNMLLELDPHSVYISEKEVEKANEPLVGNFDGIGVSFQITKDTITVIDVISRGPAEKVGMLPGDKIVTIDSKTATGDTIKNSFVFENLRGKKGTVVEVGVVRMGVKNPLSFRITRDKIPIHSIDTYFMVDDEIGYIRLDRFARTSHDEFITALTELKRDGMKSLILDLRGNSGGFLDIAFKLTNEFLDNNKMIVYTEGVSSKREDYHSTSKGNFAEGRLVVMIDEGSASASEILSGAVQDWDRGIIVGRRSFGKGLVQRPFNLADGSQVRLTTSRYYTPSGRSIQKPYKDGVDAYYQDFVNRMNHKEFVTPDSIQFPDSLKFQTHSGRTVYGGGGIMPDIFVPIDTLRSSDYMIDIRSKGILNNFVMEWVGQHRGLTETYPTYEDFNQIYTSLKIDSLFDKYAEDAGVTKNKVKNEWFQVWLNDAAKKVFADTTNPKVFTSYSEGIQNIINDPTLLKELSEKAASEDTRKALITSKSEEFLSYQLKASISRNLYGVRYYYEAVKDMDNGFLKAVEVIKNEDLFVRFNIESAPAKKTKKTKTAK